MNHAGAPELNVAWEAVITGTSSPPGPMHHRLDRPIARGKGSGEMVRVVNIEGVCTFPFHDFWNFSSPSICEVER